MGTARGHAALVKALGRWVPHVSANARIACDNLHVSARFNQENQIDP